MLAQRLAANKPPDSFQGHAGAELRDYIKAGQVEPIDFIYKQYGFDKVMPKSLLNQINYNGHLYSVPVNIHRANILWYNPTVLKKAGIAKAPKTWARVHRRARTRRRPPASSRSPSASSGRRSTCSRRS